MAYEDALVNEPDAEAGEGVGPPGPPRRRAVVDGYVQRQAEAAEGRNQRHSLTVPGSSRLEAAMRMGRLANGRPARSAGAAAARFGDREDGPRSQFLHQVVGGWMPSGDGGGERLPRAAEPARARAVRRTMSVDARARAPGRPFFSRALPTLAPAPSRTRLAHLQNRRFNRAGAAARTVIGRRESSASPASPFSLNRRSSL